MSKKSNLEKSIEVKKTELELELIKANDAVKGISNRALMLEAKIKLLNELLEE